MNLYDKIVSREETISLVGGHCIGVDPYYLTYRSQIFLSGRRINDDMGKVIAENLVKKLTISDLDKLSTAIIVRRC